MASIERDASTPQPQDKMGHYARELTQQEKECLAKDSVLVSDFKRNKLELEARRNWDLFYKRNSTHFFKDRHWIAREFPELLEEGGGVVEVEGEGGGEGGEGEGKEGGSRRVCLLEAGCGVGNTVFPLLEENSNLFVYACDFSPRAIQFLKVQIARTCMCESDVRESPTTKIIMSWLMCYLAS